MHYPGASFSVNTTAGDAPLIVFAIKEPKKLISILEKKKKQGKIDSNGVVQISYWLFFLDVQGISSDLTSAL